MDDPAPTINPSPETKAPAPKPKATKRGRWLRRGFLMLLIVSAVGWFAPAIIAHKEVRTRLTKWLAPVMPVSIDFGDSSLSWTTPIVIKDLRIDDDQGNCLVEVKEVTTSETLWNLVSRGGQLGTIKLVEPIVHLGLRDDGSNWEDAAARLPHSSSASGTPLTYVVEIENGRIELDHAVRNRKTTFEQIALRIVSTTAGLQEIDLAVGTPATAAGDGSTDWLAAKYGEGRADHSTSPVAGSKHLQLRASQWKIDRIAPLLSRCAPDAELSGELNADAMITMVPAASGTEWDWDGSVSIRQLILNGIESLKRDKLSLEQVSLSGRAAALQGRLAMHDLKVTTDVGEITATGDLPLDSPADKSSLELVQSLLSDEDYHIDGHVDLKKLAAMLPQTLRIREGTEITAGDVKVQVVGVSTNGVRRWSGTAGLTGLSAVNQGKTIPWNQPFVARINAHRDQNAVIVDLVDCKADFLQLSGSGTMADARFNASGDLSKLMSNIGKFVDLGIEQLSGQINASGELKRVDQQHVSLTSKVLLDDFAYVISKNSVWQEKHLELSVTATGQIDDKPVVTRIDRGELHLISSGDALDLVSQQPIDISSRTATFAGNASLKGNVMTWQNRLRPFVATNSWRFAGGVNLAATVSADPSKVNVSQLAMDLQKFEAHGPELLIQDPELRLTTAGQWTYSTNTWTSAKASLVGKTVSADITDLECAIGKQGLSRLVGTASYRADLAQVSGWKNLAIPNPSYYLIGSLSGTAKLVQQEGRLNGNLDAQVEKFVLAGQGNGQAGQPQWVALWKEPQIKILGQGSYDTTADKLTLDKGTFDLDGLSIAANGGLEGCATAQRISLAGDLAYDWDALAKRFGPQVSQNIQLSGKDRRPFSLRGTLASLSPTAQGPRGIAASSVSFPAGVGSNVTQRPAQVASNLADLTGQAGLGWAAANVYGFKGGAGDVSVQLNQSVCQFAPLDMVVNDGKLHVTPTIYLDRNPFLLVLPQEKLIDQVTLNAELCRNSLKYVTPMLGDSTQVDGKLSVDMQAASLPLFAPQYGTASGVLTIHHAQAQPGPTALQLLGAIEQIQSIIARRQPGAVNQNVWMEMPAQQVPVKLEQGRIYHDGLTVVVNNLTVKTSGSVGMDTSLNMVAALTIPDAWIGSNKALAGLKGKALQVPIAGTTSRPQIDPNFFAGLVQQLGGSALDGLLQDKLGNGLEGAINNNLDKLLKRR